jgi:hypothetical protein
MGLVLVVACDGAPVPMDDGGSRDAGGARDGGSPRDGGTPRDGGGTPDGDGGAEPTLSELHPGDEGLGAHPDVVWFEDFEAGSTAAIAARYDQVRDEGRWQLVNDTPSGRGAALALRAGDGRDAVDFYKRLPDADEWYVRWYARYEAGAPWHHSGMWIGGYNPGMSWPSPNAGRRPNGDDRFSIAIEPVYGSGSSRRFDFYNYWMGMRSWMAAPIMDNGTAYYGNSLVHQDRFTVDEDTWVCLELHVRLNPDPATGTGALLEVWKNDALVERFDDAGPRGYWVRDKFCPEDADGAECTDYRAPAEDVLDLRFRSTTALRLNAFWPQNYISTAGSGTLTFDQMVVATRRIGCMR